MIYKHKRLLLPSPPVPPGARFSLSTPPPPPPPLLSPAHVLTLVNKEVAESVHELLTRVKVCSIESAQRHRSQFEVQLMLLLLPVVDPNEGAQYVTGHN